MIRRQRIFQTCSVLLFIHLLVAAGSFTTDEYFLRRIIALDPAASLGTALAAHALFAGMAGALVLLVLTLIFGRFFCGHICPLGACIDLADHLPRRQNRFLPKISLVRTGVFLILCGAACGGLSLLFAFAPLALSTRLVALLGEPLLRLGAAFGVDFLRTLCDGGWLTFAHIRTPFYSPILPLAIVTLMPFLGTLIARRFWCRAVCPAGALFSCAAQRPALTRQVAEKCIRCGRCRKACPTEAIGTDPRITRHGECITCRHCAAVCPVHAINFSFSLHQPAGSRCPDPGRRTLLVGGTAALVGGGFLLSTTRVPEAADSVPLRPPGARPEIHFLRRCIGCGACMAVCPTNTLQPSGFDGPWRALLSPLLTPAVGPCRTDCARCGQFCPTAAILPLTAEEKIWARPGSARIDKKRCLAWQEERACLVCDEVCPFAAIVLVRVPGIGNAVPEVITNRCSGCGYCEHECPVAGTRAIVVNADGALRLNDSNHRREGLKSGLDIRLQAHEGYPGGTENHLGLPPGFTP